MTPQLILKLSPTGLLQIEFWWNGQRRLVDIEKEADAGRVLRRCLEAQLRGNVAVGLDGAPTEHQMRHWQRHDESFFGDPKCPFCVAEGRFTARGSHKPKLARREHTVGDGSVVVRYHEKSKRRMNKAGLKAEDLGL